MNSSNLAIFILLTIMVASLSIISSIVAIEIRNLFGYRKFALSVIHLILLLPWLGHYFDFLMSANSGMQPWQIYLVPLFLTFIVICVVQIESKSARVSNSIVPFLAFIVTRYYVMPTVYGVNQDYVYDNIPTIWLFFWSIIATSMIFSYVISMEIFGKKCSN